ncbi:CBS domain-containing protein [Cupriavidus pinatubonensis]|uniref:CBS domain-containing protein n=1 Tax=Cupriavidus pinatubonensis TaxID=248026 RepID=UPI001FCFA39A|nr:CBS domain-containing protein [Cupriavidus pinatubonensis]
MATQMQTQRTQHRRQAATPTSSLRLRDVMTANPQYITPDCTLQEAAKLMDDLNVGTLPVCVDGQLRGMVTDRDITCRCIAVGKDPQTRIVDAMSERPLWCRDDDTIDDALAKMAERQIRRVPVIDKDDRLVGIVSLGDIATKSGDIAKAGDTLTEVSNPSEPDR